MPTIAITGATGFTGSALAHALASEGHDIVAIVRPTSDRSALDGINISWVEADVTEPDTLNGAFDTADWLIHSAGLLGQAGISEDTYQKIHVDGTDNVLAAAGHCSRILHISSPGVLGPIEGSAADESAPIAPSNPYERSKAMAEKVALNYASRGRPIVIARPEFIYGPGDRHVLGIFQAVHKGVFFYIDGGRSCCHPTFIEDAVAGMILCLKHGVPGEIYHITGPRPVSFRDLGQAIASSLAVNPPRWSIPRPVAMVAAMAMEAMGKILGKAPPLSRNGVAFFSEDRQFSWEKARVGLGYSPKYDLDAGVQKTVNWYRKHGFLPVEDRHEQ